MLTTPKYVELDPATEERLAIGELVQGLTKDFTGTLVIATQPASMPTFSASFCSSGYGIINTAQGLKLSQALKGIRTFLERNTK